LNPFPGGGGGISATADNVKQATIANEQAKRTMANPREVKVNTQSIYRAFGRIDAKKIDTAKPAKRKPKRKSKGKAIG
jgi:hypothetical protein